MTQDSPSTLRRAILRHGFVFVTLINASQILLPAEINSISTVSLPGSNTVVIPKLQSAVKIDGDLGESAWRNAAVLKPLRSHDGSIPEFEQTEVRIWYNDQALYLGWTCHDTNIQASLTNRDGNLWEEEAVEFFVTPNALNRYLEFQWNPLGTIFDAVVTNRLDEQNTTTGYNFDSTFNASNLVSAVIRTGEDGDAQNRTKGWQVETMIPFKEISAATPKSKEVWRGNFFRINRGLNQTVQFFCWSPTYSPWFHQPKHFGHLEFGD